MRSFASLAVRQVRARRMRSLLTTAGIVLGVGMILGVLLLAVTILAAFVPPAARRASIRRWRCDVSEAIVQKSSCALILMNRADSLRTCPRRSQAERSCPTNAMASMPGANSPGKPTACA